MMDWSRFGHRPDSVKIILLFATILVLLSTSAAIYQPVGTGIIWTTGILALTSNLLSILILGTGLEHIFASHKYRTITWSLFEVLISLLYAILYFISIWICVHGANYGSTTAFGVAGFFCVINFFVYLYNFFLYIQIWMREMRVANEQMTPTFENAVSYGAP
ncbi:hypothetical protein FO519_004260 [Halicephalobus sp. NKZ332]|nr:hypothetical protein FO519_004260 [Halicephalobus sp. NKZ332]